MAGMADIVDTVDKVADTVVVAVVVDSPVESPGTTEYFLLSNRALRHSQLHMRRRRPSVPRLCSRLKML